MKKSTEKILHFENIKKEFLVEGIKITALENINLVVHSGEFIGVTGKSGSGKTSLLNIAGLIDPPTKGKLFIKGHNANSLRDQDASFFRAKEIGFIFQSFNLLPLLSVLENVEYPLMLLKVPGHERLLRAKEALEKVGLIELAKMRPDQLSGGQRQRVAIARSIVKNPTLILADEPTANLDAKSTSEVLDLLAVLHRELNTTIIVCSHDPNLIAKTQRQLKLSNGCIVDDSALEIGGNYFV